MKPEMQARRKRAHVLDDETRKSEVSERVYEADGAHSQGPDDLQERKAYAAGALHEDSAAAAEDCDAVQGGKHEAAAEGHTRARLKTSRDADDGVREGVGGRGDRGRACRARTPNPRHRDGAGGDV